MRNSYIIALNTFRELVRSKILYSFLFAAVFFVCISTVLTTASIGDAIKILKDFGLMVISLCSVAFVTVAGSALLAKELSRKTVFNILAKPVGRSEFLYGKFLGMFATGAVIILCLGTALSGYLYLFEERIDPLLWLGYLGITFELLIICACAIFFSSAVVTPVLAGLFTLGVFVAGRSVNYLLAFTQDPEMPEVLRGVGSLLYWVFPHLNSLYFANDVIFGVAVPTTELLMMLGYAVSYSVVLLTLATVLFKRRNFN